MNKSTILALSLLALLLVSACTAPASTTSNTTASTGIANPASKFCVDQGFKNEIRTNADGSQTGYCIFGNGKECEEWAYMRGDCKNT